MLAGKASPPLPFVRPKRTRGHSLSVLFCPACLSTLTPWGPDHMCISSWVSGLQHATWQIGPSLSLAELLALCGLVICIGCPCSQQRSLHLYFAQLSRFNHGVPSWSKEDLFPLAKQQAGSYLYAVFTGMEAEGRQPVRMSYSGHHPGDKALVLMHSNTQLLGNNIHTCCSVFGS